MLEDAAPARYDSPALDALARQCGRAFDEFGGIPGVQAAALARKVAVPGPRRNGQARAGAVPAGSLRRGAKRPDLVWQYGRCFWDPELLEQDVEAERGGSHLPRPSGAPRLFLSYRWTYDDDDLGSWVEEFASWLFNRGYEIVYDRDPRHIEKGFTSNDLLALLPSCSQMIALVTDGTRLGFAANIDQPSVSGIRASSPALSRRPAAEAPRILDPG